MATTFARATPGLAAWAAAMALAGCADVTRFSAGPDESFCGDVTAASFVRAGIPEGTKMRLELRPEKLQTEPGRIWTGPLGASERLSGTELRVIPELFHDPLSTFSFGEGRLKNGLYVADVGGTQVMVVLSLLESGEVEVRLLRGAPSADAGPSPLPPLFGVFRLRRERGNCGLP